MDRWATEYEKHIPYPECAKIFGKRSKLGDPAFWPDVPEYERHITDPQTATFIRHQISDDHTLNISAYNPDNYEVPLRWALSPNHSDSDSSRPGWT